MTTLMKWSMLIREKQCVSVVHFFMFATLFDAMIRLIKRQSQKLHWSAFWC